MLDYPAQPYSRSMYLYLIIWPRELFVFAAWERPSDHAERRTAEERMLQFRSQQMGVCLYNFTIKFYSLTVVTPFIQHLGVFEEYGKIMELC